MTALVTDIDGTLTGHDRGLKELNSYLSLHREEFYIVYATGRCLEEFYEINSAGLLIDPDAAIINTGADILVKEGRKYVSLDGWHTKIDDTTWDSGLAAKILAQVPGITAQAHLSRYKVSFFTDPAESAAAGDRVREALNGAGIRAKIIISHGKFVDILPEKCDKGEAAAYLLKLKKISFKDVIAAGDSENDLDMFMKFEKGIVVSNARAELKEQLKGRDVFFAPCNCAAGILEGLKYYLRNY
jgi:sucrose-6F-phosphate phosphohydrolase